MDPLTHTLTGACLAESGLRRATPLAAPTLVIAAVAPDIDAACYFVGADVAFLLRRGWTHGLLAWFVWPLVIAGAALAFDALVRRRRSPELEPARAGPLLALSALGILTHAFLDWFNTYGIRLLSPASDRWFYGDTLFIADPWLWLLLGAGVALAWTRTRAGAAVAALLALAATGLMWANPLVPAPAWARATWGVALVAWLALWWRVSPGRIRLAARLSLALGVVYIGTVFAASRAAETNVRRLAEARGWDVERTAAMPEPFDPLRRTVIVVTPREYLFVPVTWTRPHAAGDAFDTMPRGSLDPAVAAALESPLVGGARRWLRFPAYEVRERPDGGYRVTLRDARFAIRTRPGFGVVGIVDLDWDLRQSGQ